MSSTVNNISKILTPDGVEYLIKDAKARSDIEELRGIIAAGVKFLGVTTTELTDGATTSPIYIDGVAVVPTSGSIVIYNKPNTSGIEFIFGNSKWWELGSTGSLKALAFKDSASGDYTPAGSISMPGITVTPATKSIEHVTMVADSSTETLTIGVTTETVMTGATAALNSAPVFTGSSATIVVR